jgi:hypothetical protein
MHWAVSTPYRNPNVSGVCIDWQCLAAGARFRHPRSLHCPEAL